MRRSYRSVTPGVVRSVVLDQLREALGWKPSRSVSVDQLLRLVVLAATGLTSVFGVVRRFFGFSPASAYRVLRANCPSLDAVATGLNAGLHRVLALSRLDRRRRWVVAVDLHLVPYYGRRTPAVVGGPPKAGTPFFHGYATAVLVHKGRRYTVALDRAAGQAARDRPPAPRSHRRIRPENPGRHRRPLVRRRRHAAAVAGPRTRLRHPAAA